MIPARLDGMRWFGVLILLIFVLLPVAVLAQEGEETATSEEVVASEEEAAIEPAADTTDQPVFHVIVAGDTLFSIAVQYDTTIPELERINNLTPDSVLHIGQELIISGVVPLPIGATVVDAPDLLEVAGLPAVPKVHIVQGGENLSGIAALYDLSAETLLETNQLDNDAALQIGQQLIVPGQTGDIIARDYVVEFGDSLERIAAEFNTRSDLLLVDEHTVNPQRLVVGQTLRLASRTGSAEKQPQFGSPHQVEAGETLTTIGAHYNLPPQQIAEANGMRFPTPLPVGQQLRIPSGELYEALSAELTTIKISAEPLRQGEAFTLYLESAETITPTGQIRFTDIISAPNQPWFYDTYIQTFPFAPYADGYVAIVGLDSFTHPGLYEIELFTDGDDQADFVRTVEVVGVAYGFQSIPLEDVVDVRSAENARLEPLYRTYSLTSTFPITQTFISPLDDAYRSAAYGAARSYAGAPVRIFHTGVDFAAPANTPIYAVADGVVIFSEFTELRGNVVILDHGLGIKTGYFHLSQLLVQVGDVVVARTAIGALGNTGLSTGAHLHWDVRINNVPINGQQWLAEPIFPFEFDR